MSAPGLGGGLRRATLVKLVVGVVLALAIVGWGLTRVFSGDSEVSWIPVAVDDLVLTVEVEGTLASREASMVTPPQVSEVQDFQISFMAAEGADVAAGEPVLGFDVSQLEQRLLQLQTDAQQADKNIEKLDVDLEQQLMGMRLELAEAQAEARRAALKNDVPDDLRAANQAEVDGLDLELATRRVASLEGRLNAAADAGAAQRQALVAQRDRAVRLVEEVQNAVEAMTVTAPRPGTVIYVTNWRGDKKKVGDQVWRREEIIELPDLSTMMARGEVDESDAGRISDAQVVTLRLDAHPDVLYRARIESIWRTVQRKSFSRNPIKVVRIELDLEETDVERMRPGMRFRGEIETERVEGVLVVPVHAVFPTADGPVVFRKTVFGHESVPVELGRRSSDMVEVLGGLAVGDRISGTSLAS
ncbi:MAG: HlyD family efflux transporter periplasmic adaptor subunit [Acidobacteria bacterium]|nr:HlyD family efflux transporter periplasmic adaptor subunit [Acidobacteriota bacterium]